MRFTCRLRSSCSTMRFMEKIAADWNNQPLAILTQVAGVAIATTTPFLLSLSLPSYSTTHFALPAASVAISISMAAALILATFCRLVFKATVIGGFFVSLILAAICLMVASVGERPLLIKTTVYSNGTYQGPLVDLIYWSIYSEFVAICCVPAMSRIVATWGQMSTTDESGTRQKLGVAPFEFLIFAAVWGWALSGAQQKIIGAFIFQQPPKVASIVNP